MINKAKRERTLGWQRVTVDGGLMQSDVLPIGDRFDPIAFKRGPRPLTEGVRNYRTPTDEEIFAAKPHLFDEESARKLRGEQGQRRTDPARKARLDAILAASKSWGRPSRTAVSRALRPYRERILRARRGVS